MVLSRTIPSSNISICSSEEQSFCSETELYGTIRLYGSLRVFRMPGQCLNSLRVFAGLITPSCLKISLSLFARLYVSLKVQKI